MLPINFLPNVNLGIRNGFRGQRIITTHPKHSGIILWYHQTLLVFHHSVGVPNNSAASSYICPCKHTTSILSQSFTDWTNHFTLRFNSCLCWCGINCERHGVCSQEGKNIVTARKVRKCESCFPYIWLFIYGFTRAYEKRRVKTVLYSGDQELKRAPQKPCNTHLPLRTSTFYYPQPNIDMHSHT